jgi:WD40 repeat protein
MRLGRARFLEADWVVALAYSPDGRRLAAVDRKGMILIWDRLTGRELSCWPPGRVPRGWGPPFNDLAFTPDGKRLVAGGRAGVRVFDTSSGKILDGFPGYPLNGTHISLSADGRFVATMESPAVASPQPITVWDLGTGTKDERLTKRLAGFMSAFFSPDGRALAAVVSVAGPADHRIAFLDVKSGKQLGEVTVPAKWRPDLVFSPDGRVCAAIDDEDRVRAWTVPEGKPAGDFVTGQRRLGFLAFLDADRVVTAGADGTARVRQLPSGKELLRLEHTDDTACALSPDGKVLTSAWTAVRHYELATAQERSEPITAGGPVAFSTSGKLLAYAPPVETPSAQPVITLTEWQSGRSLRLTGHTKPVRALGFTDKDAALASGGTEPSVRVWDTKTGKERHHAVGRLWHSAFDVSPKRGGVAFVTVDQTVGMVDTATGNAQTALLPLKDDQLPLDAAAVAFSADGQNWPSPTSRRTARRTGGASTSGTWAPSSRRRGSRGTRAITSARSRGCRCRQGGSTSPGRMAGVCTSGTRQPVPSGSGRARPAASPPWPSRPMASCWPSATATAGSPSGT